ncbi:MAG TPA: triose-phosphate isomerase [Bryobacteraceae bacterium]|jgi:triosephosphate isomerase|nr:triose-phosphate isomerase [Bryobacteraceae bacterium]
MRKPVMAGNWKMYKTAAETSSFFEKFSPLVAGASHADVVICPPFVNIPAAVEGAKSTAIGIGAQDVFWLQEGAYTGEVSAPMLTAVGCRWVIIGHSERRQYFHETEETVFKKTVAALDAGLNPIVCVGENLDERESNSTEAVCGAQFAGGLGSLTREQFTRVVIAYEPVWAIGTGKTATPEMAAAAHRFIRGEARNQFGTEVASACRILYGGSVKADNVKGLMAQEEIDGALVGGASLDPASFASIVNFL